MSDRDVLGTIPFFAEVLDDRSLDALVAGAMRVEYDRGATILSENDPGESMFVIISGAVTVSIHNGGRDLSVATLHDGDIIGEMSLLTGAPRTATVSALRPTVALEIAKPALAPLLADHRISPIALRRRSRGAKPNWTASTAPCTGFGPTFRRAPPPSESAGSSTGLHSAGSAGQNWLSSRSR